MDKPGCFFCDNFIIYKEMSVEFKEEGFYINFLFCRRCFRRLKANIAVCCRGCGGFGMINKKKYLVKNADTLEKKPATVLKLNSEIPSFMAILECRICKSERFGWLVEGGFNGK